MIILVVTKWALVEAKLCKTLNGGHTCISKMLAQYPLGSTFSTSGLLCSGIGCMLSKITTQLVA